MRLRELYEQYRDRVQFITVYIREAHPRDGWWLGEGLVGKLMRKKYPLVAFDVTDPKTMAERHEVAQRCQLAFQLDMLMLVDDMDNAVDKAYAARPTRLYLIDLDGRVVYAGGIGPWGLKPAELKKALDDYLTPDAHQNSFQPQSPE